MTRRNDGRLVYSTETRLSKAERVEQAPEALNKEQRELAHQMSCTRAGCLRCGE